MINITLAGHSGDLEKLMIDKSLVGKLSAECVADGRFILVLFHCEVVHVSVCLTLEYRFKCHVIWISTEELKDLPQLTTNRLRQDYDKSLQTTFDSNKSLGTGNLNKIVHILR